MNEQFIGGQKNICTRCLHKYEYIFLFYLKLIKLTKIKIELNYIYSRLLYKIINIIDIRFNEFLFALTHLFHFDQNIFFMFIR